MKDVAAVIVTYNRKQLLMECIDAIFQQRPLAPDVIVIDNHSTDGTAGLLESYKDSIKYFNTGSNLGGAGGFHFGIKKATELGYKYLWIMDDDCIPNKEALNALLLADGCLKGNYGFLSSKVLWKDGSICNMNVQRKTLTRKLNELDSGMKTIAMASFVSLFVKSDVIKAFGLPIKEFFIWTDDWEFTRRISREMKCYYVPDSIVVHKSNSNVGAQIYNDTIERIDRYAYLYRNDVYLYRREGLTGFFYELIRLSSHVLKVLFKATDNKKKRISAIFAGTKNGLSFNPIIEFPNME